MVKGSEGVGWGPWLWCAGVLALGVMFLVLSLPQAPDYGPVYCDGKVMGAGDFCNVVVNGSGGLHSYEGLLAKKREGRGVDPIALTFGSAGFLIGGGGLAYLIRSALRKRGWM